MLTAGLLGYASGTDSRRDAAFYESITDSATVLTHSSPRIDAVRAFTPAFAELHKTPLPQGASEAVSNYYNGAFGPELVKGAGQSADPNLFMPNSNASVKMALTDTAIRQIGDTIELRRRAARAALAEAAQGVR